MSGDVGRSRAYSPEDSHGSEAWAYGETAYAHLGWMTGAVGALPLAQHLRDDHGVEPSQALYGARWCRDVEAHAAAHGVTLSTAATTAQAHR